MALMVEVMCAALAGALRGPDMESFMEDDGHMVGCGEFFIAIESRVFSGGVFAQQIKAIRAHGRPMHAGSHRLNV